MVNQTYTTVAVTQLLLNQLRCQEYLILWRHNITNFLNLQMPECECGYTYPIISFLQIFRFCISQVRRDDHKRFEKSYE